ncbi:MAG: hypothetical protein Q4G05_04180 [Clostridia bacterium]|nr:hypothetical protein [Clostridia bacterium]
MIKNINEKLNEFLKGEKITKENFDDLKNIANFTQFNEKILNWFRYLQSLEIVGWRNKFVTKKICDILEKNEPIQFYSLFCPSYIKGEGADGFRTDDVGNTTKVGLERLEKITEETKKMGFLCKNPEAIFFDIALEQPEKTIHKLEELTKNIENFKKYVPKDMNFMILSEKFPELKDIVGYNGIIIEPLPINDIILKRIVDRGKKFYELFGWSERQILERSKIIASSEAVVGMFLRNQMSNAIMIYTPTMLERAQVYSGVKQEEPLAIIMPRKD